MANYYEKRPLLIRRRPAYYESLPAYVQAAASAAAPDGLASELFSVQQFKQLISDGKLTFESDLDVTQYTDGQRWTLNGTGTVQLDSAWSKQMEQDGCSLRMRCPQAHVPAIHALCSHLEDFWGTFVGSNAYLTPPSTQGFAPHFDDIEAFILQLSGQKHWRVYPPRNADETLPKYSSPNFEQDEIGSPCLEATLCAGDMLYFPKGWVHQADTVGNVASLHVTISCGQQSTWGDLMQFALDSALRRALSETPALRRLPPRGYARYMGTLVGHDAAAADDTGNTLAAALSGAAGTVPRSSHHAVEPFAEGSAVACLGASGAEVSAAKVSTELPAMVADTSARNCADVACDEWGMVAPVGVELSTDGSKQLSANPSSHELQQHRSRFLTCATTLVESVFRMVDEAALDDAADALALKFLKERLPTLAASHANASTGMAASSSAAGPPAVSDSQMIQATSAIRLVNPLATRITLQDTTDDGERVEGGVAVVTCSAQNSKRFLHKAPETVQFPASFAPAIEALLAAHPAAVLIGDLPVLVDDDGSMLPASQADAGEELQAEDSDDEQPGILETLCDVVDALVAINAVEVVA